MSDIKQEIKNLSTKIDMLSLQSPRMSRNNAKRFLKLGEDKFRLLIKMGLIKEYRDEFNQRYFLRHNLMNYLESVSHVVNN